jgi:hypothetical protein
MSFGRTVGAVAASEPGRTDSAVLARAVATSTGSVSGSAVAVGVNAGISLVGQVAVVRAGGVRVSC